MTREERELSIEYLKGIKENYIEGYGYERHPLPEYYAIENAIKALEQESCEDAISRQAVIDAIDKWAKNMSVLIALPVNEVTPLFEDVHGLPSVNPQPKTSDEQNDHLPRCNEWMFQTVKCSSYLKKVKDGKYIDKREENGTTKWFCCDSNHPDSDIPFPDEDFGFSEGGLIKVYYADTPKTFYGVVIGMKLVTVKANLFVDCYEDYISVCGQDYETYYEYVDKHPTEQVICLVVAFGCNRTRLVPIASAQVEP